MKCWFFLGVALVSVLLLGGCISAGTQQDMLRVGLITYVGQGPFFVAQEKGFFAEEGIQVEFVSFSDPATLKSAFLGKQIEVYNFTVDSFAFDAANGLSGKIVWVPSISYGADGIIAGNEIQAIKDLKGKKVAFFEGSPSHFFLSHLLKQEGLQLSDIEAINLEPDKAAQAFFAGEADAAVTWEPWLSKVKDISPDAKILASTKDFPELILDAFIVQDDMLPRKQETLVRFFRALQRGIRYAEENPQEAAQIAAPYFNMTTEEYLESIQIIHFLGGKDNYRLFAVDGTVKQRLIEAAKTWEEAGLAARQVQADELFDPRIAQQAQ